jgi:hypothetical protein
MLLSDPRRAAPTLKLEYGAYARSMAANARSRNMVIVLASPGSSTVKRSPTGI